VPALLVASSSLSAPSHRSTPGVQPYSNREAGLHWKVHLCPAFYWAE
jgi:hypothetical protein